MLSLHSSWLYLFFFFLLQWGSSNRYACAARLPSCSRLSSDNYGSRSGQRESLVYLAITNHSFSAELDGCLIVQDRMKDTGVL